ncbi:Tn3 family transposase [Phyllobacterium sp. KW56]|uniref:Tn3 family transposase n=1 Tax=Phyllobacterium chamaecytisi TaxID=2876082 RepID=UPI0021063A58
MAITDRQQSCAPYRHPGKRHQLSFSPEWRTFHRYIIYQLPSHDWHIRKKGSRSRTLVNAQRQLPLASLWGDQTTSSSDGQYFPAGGHAEAIGDLNARYDPTQEPNSITSYPTGTALSTSLL